MRKSCWRRSREQLKLLEYEPTVLKHLKHLGILRALYLDERTLTYEPIVNYNIASKFV